MMPNEYAPVVLNAEQQRNHDRYTALGFKISARPFAGRGTGKVLYFFLSLNDVEFTIELSSGRLHQTGTTTFWMPDEAERHFGVATISPASEEPAVLPPTATRPVNPAQETAAVLPPKPVDRPRPVEQSATPKGTAPTKKKQTALF